MLRKILSLIVIATFLFNEVAFALSPQVVSGNPDSPVRQEMYAAGQKLFAIKEGPGSELVSNIEEAVNGIYVGKEPWIEGVEFIKADDNKPPEGWENNPIFGKTDLVEAFKYFRDNEAHIEKENLDIKEGYFEVNEAMGELPIARIESNKDGTYTLILHTKFVQMWDHIRANDVRFKITNERTASLAWGIFYRVAKHEMADIYKETLGRKGGGHLNKKDIQAGYTNMYPNDVDELFANKIGGKYNIINDGLWMWFLGSYCFGNSTRYNKNILEGRLRWFFGEEGRQYGLSAEFPNIYEYSLVTRYSGEREFAIKLALAVNYHFFKDRSSAKVPEFTVKPSYVVEAQARKAGIKNVLPATGTDGQPAVTIEHPIPHFVAENDAKALKGLTIFRPEEILPASALKTSEKKSSIGRSHSPGKNPFDAFTKVIARSEVLRKGSFTLKQYAAEHSWIQKRYGDIEPLVQNWEATVIGDLYGEGLKDQPSLEHLDLIKRLEDKTDKGEVRLELTTNGNNLLRANKRESIEELFKVLCDPEIQEFGRNISILYEGGGKVAIRIKRFTQLLGKSTDSIRYVDIVITKNFPSIYSGSVKWYHDRGSFGLSYLEPDALSLLGELKRDQRRWDEWLKEARADNVAAKDKLSTAPPEIAVRPASIHQGGDLSVDQVRAFVLKPGRTAEEIIDLLQTNKAFEQADLVKQILTDAGTEYAATLAEYNRLLEHEKSMFAIASMAGFGVPGSFYSRIDIRREWWGRQLVSKWWEMEVAGSYRFAVSSLWRPPIVKWSQDQGEMFAVTFRPQGTYTDLENFHDITEFEFSPNKFLVPMTIEVPGRALVGVDFSQAQESGRTTWVVEASYFGALIKGMVDLEIIKAKDAEAVAKAGIIEVQQEVGMYYNETMTVRLISSDHPDGKLILDGKKLAAQTVSVNADSEVEATIRKLKTAVRNKHWIITRFLARKLISLTGREAIMTIVEVIKIADQKKSSRTTRLLTEELVSLAVKGGMPTIEEAVNVARRYEARDVVVALNEKLDELKRTVAIQTAPAGLTALTTLKIVANTVDVSILTDDVLGNIVGVLMGKTLFAANLLSIFSSNMGRFGDISRGPSSQNISTDKVRVAQGNLYLEMNAEQFLVFLKEARQREPSRIIDVMKLHTGLFKEGSVVDRHFMEIGEALDKDINNSFLLGTHVRKLLTETRFEQGMTELEILSRIKILAEDIRKPAENLLRIIEKIHSELNTTAPVATEEIKLHDALIKAVGMPVEEKYPSKRHTGMLGAVSLIFPAHEGPGWRNGIIEEFKLLGRNAKNLQLDEIKRAVQVPIRGDEYGLTEKAENCGTVAVLLPEDKGVPQVRMMHVPFAIGLNSLSMNEKLLFDSISDLLEPEKAFERPPVFFLDIREDILMARDGSGKNLLDKAADLLNKHGIAVVALTRSRYSRSALLTDKNGVALFTETFDPADSYIEFDPIRSWLFTTKDGNPKKTATSISWDRLQKEVAAKGLFIKWDDPAQSGGNITDAGMVRPQFPVIGEGKDLYEHYVTLSSKDYDIFKIHFNGRKLSELSGEEIAEVASSVKSRFNTPFRIELVLLQHIAYRLGLYGKDKEVTAQIETLVYGFNWTVWSNPPDAPSYIALTPEQGWENGLNLPRLSEIIYNADIKGEYRKALTVLMLELSENLTQLIASIRESEPEREDEMSGEGDTSRREARKAIQVKPITPATAASETVRDAGSGRFTEHLGKNPDALLTLIRRNIKPGDVISAPILYDSYLAQHKEPGYESPARRSSVLEMIRHDLFRAHNSLSEAGFVRELPEKGPNNERQFVEVVYEVKNTEGLVKDIVDFTARYAPLYGPGSGREKEILAPGSATVEDIYKTVALLSDNKIEILIPCSVGLTDTVKNTLSKIRQNKGEKSVVCRLFDSEDHLRDMLSIKPKDGVKRIIISDNIATKMAINNLVKIDAKLFIGVRLLSVVLPENYNNLNRQDQGVYQADIITRAILVRLLERNGNPFVRSLFKRLIEERIESNIIENADAFIDNLIESENEAQDSEAVLKRIHYCLSIMINLVAKIGEQLIILRHFVWTAA